MNRKLQTFAIMLIVGIITLLSVGMVAAQDDGGDAAPEATPQPMPMPPMREGGVMQVILDETGLSPREFMEAVRDAESVAAVIEANGGNVEVVISTAEEAAAERVNQAVENGRITRERADEILASLNERITAFINGEGELPGRLRDRLGERFGGRGGPGFGEGRFRERGNFIGRDSRVLRELAGIIRDETDLTLRELGGAMRGGSTLPEVLAENDVDVTSLVDAMLAEVETRLNERAEAGDITQERADEILTQLERALLNGLTVGEPPQ